MKRRSHRQAGHWVWLLAGGLVLGILALEAGPGIGVLLSRPVVASLADGRAGKMRLASDAAKGRPLIAAELILPAPTPGRAPAAILLHGSDGVGAHQYRYARLLAKWGFAVLVLDSFGPRGVASTVGDQDAVPAQAMVADAYAALRLLVTHPRVDPERIVLIGWSKGGIAAMWAARRLFQRRLAPEGPRFAAHVAFYPWCGSQEAQIRQTGAPMLLLLGARDDWTGAASCVEYARRLRAAGTPAQAIVYPEAEHGFDYEGRFRSYVPAAHGYGACEYFSREAGFVVARTGRFERWAALPRYLRACRVQGAHVGTNTAARTRAAKDLHEFLGPIVTGARGPAAK